MRVAGGGFAIAVTVSLAVSLAAAGVVFRGKEATTSYQQDELWKSLRVKNVAP